LRAGFENMTMGTWKQYDIYYTLYFPGRKPEGLCAEIKARSAEEAIRYLTNQRDWYDGDRSKWARVRVTSLEEIIETAHDL